MADFNSQFAFSSRHIPLAKSILGQYLIEVAPPEIDMQENADLLWLIGNTNGHSRIGLRARQFHNLRPEWYWQFTIRKWSKYNGHSMRTEWDKILDGYGDLLLYLVPESTKKAFIYTLVDLSAFRDFVRPYLSDLSQFPQHNNTDGRTGLIAFDARRLPTNCIIGWRQPNYEMDGPIPVHPKGYYAEPTPRLQGVMF